MTTKRALAGTTNQASPWEPAPAIAAEIHAIQAIYRGDATAAQQALLVQWLRKATAVGELEFRGDSERATCFASGKRFVGLQFFTLVKATPPKEQ